MSKRILIIGLIALLPSGLWALTASQATEVVNNYYESLRMYAQNPASNPQMVIQWFTTDNVVYNDIYGVITGDYSRHNRCAIKDYVTYVGGYYNNNKAKLSISYTITGKKYTTTTSNGIQIPEYLVYVTKRVVGNGTKYINITTYEELAVREVAGSHKIQRIAKKNEPYVEVQRTNTSTISDNGQLTYTQPDGSKFYLNGTAIAPTGNAIGLSYLTETINKNNACQNGAITEKIGVIIYGDYGYAHTGGFPSKLAETIKDANANKHTIHDITLSNNGNYWCILYGNGGWHAMASEGFYSKLREYLGNNEKVRSVAIRDNGDYVIVSDKHFYASTTELKDFIIAARDKYGTVHSVSLSNKGIVVCAENGVCYKNIPTGTLDRLKIAAPQFKIRYVKFTDTGTCLITDGKSRYDYWM